MGNFAVAAMRDGGLTDDQLDFYQFPVINPDVDYAEDAPTDTFHLASGAQNPKPAWNSCVRDFCRSPRRNADLGQLPELGASVSDDKFIQEGFEMLSKNAGGGIMQFFDRDFSAEWHRLAWKVCKNSWSSQTTLMTSWSVSKTRASASTNKTTGAALSGLPHPISARARAGLSRGEFDMAASRTRRGTSPERPASGLVQTQ